MKTILLFLCISLILPFSSTFADDFSVVMDRVGQVQGDLPSATPNAPSGGDTKGFVGEIISKIFGGDGKIRNIFISAFKNIGDKTNNFLIWDVASGGFQHSRLYYENNNVRFGSANEPVNLEVYGDITADDITANDIAANDITATTVTADNFANPDGSSIGGGKFVDGTNPVNAVYTDGNVGIGTSTPLSKLEVRVGYSGSSSSAMRIGNSGAYAFTEIYSSGMEDDGNVPYLSFHRGGRRAWQIGLLDSNFTIAQGGGPSTSDLFVKKSFTIAGVTGNVGIGTTTPSSKLEVAGKIEADEYCDRNGQNCQSAVNLGQSTPRSWRNTKSYRTARTIYQNVSGGEMFVSISTSAGGGRNSCRLDFKINGLAVFHQINNNGSWGKTCSMVIPVPAGASYELSNCTAYHGGCTIVKWMEYR